MKSTNELLNQKLVSLLRKEPENESLWELELEDLIQNQTLIGQHPNKFYQFRDTHLIKRFIKELLEQKINPNHQTYAR